MVNDNNQDWVDARVATLTAPPEWEPDTQKGLRSLQIRQRQQLKTTQVQRRALIAGGLTVAAGGVTLSAFPVARAFAERCVDACVAQTNTWLGTTTPLPPSALAPDFKLGDVQLSALRGKVVLVNFWAPWCRPCLVEMPWFDEMQKAYGDQGLVVVGISVDANPKHKVDYRIVVDNAGVADKYGVEALPSTFLVGRNGAIAHRHAGLVSKEVYESEIRQLLSLR